jgi:hypothetical protein
LALAFALALIFALAFGLALVLALALAAGGDGGAAGFLSAAKAGANRAEQSKNKMVRFMMPLLNIGGDVFE